MKQVRRMVARGLAGAAGFAGRHWVQRGGKVIQQCNLFIGIQPQATGARIHQLQLPGQKGQALGESGQGASWQLRWILGCFQQMLKLSAVAGHFYQPRR